MASDRSLNALLRALRDPSESADTSRLLGSANQLLTLLSNPLNISLLTSQLLTSPAIWARAPILRTSFQLVGVFNAAIVHVTRNGQDECNGVPTPGPRSFSAEEWVKSVVKGADEKSPRWKHLLVLGGLLTGIGSQNSQVLSHGLRHSLEAAIVTATNLALEDGHTADAEELHAVCFVLGHVFDLLSDFEKSRLNHDKLLSAIMNSVFFSRDGFHWGYFLGTMDSDILQGNGNKFFWSNRSRSYSQAQRIASSPLIGVLGALSRLAAFCIRCVPVELVYQASDSLQRFSRSLSIQWQQNKLSEVDISEEALFLDEETRARTMPTLWQLLKSALFFVVVVQSALLGRVISDNHIAVPRQLGLSAQFLHTLRHLYFITVRLGHGLFSQHTFVYMGAIDILTHDISAAEAFLQDIRPSEFGKIPAHPYARLLDLFFLNTAENFTLILPLQSNLDLILGAAAAYTRIGHDPRLIDVFEAAHSATLAVFAAPQNHSVTIDAIPKYIDTLFRVFPTTLSARQFRLAIRSLVQITCAPGPILTAQPFLGATIMELVFSRVFTASDSPLPSLPHQQVLEASAEPPMSEQSALVLTLIDALPNLSVPLLQEWLPLTADAIDAVIDRNLHAICRDRFWDVLNGGEMDVARAQLCIQWWTSRGGREIVLHDQLTDPNYVGQKSQTSDAPMMSGALPEARNEKL